MKSLSALLTLVILTTFVSCGDCLQNASGTVIDEQTNLPIQGVQIQKENNVSIKEETDVNGCFSVTGISGGLFDCPPMTIIITKDGYDTIEIKIENASHDTIKLKPLK